MIRRSITLRVFFLTLGFITLLAGTSFSQTSQILSVSAPPTGSSCTNTNITVNVQLGCTNWQSSLDSIAYNVVGDTIYVGVYYTDPGICLPAIAFPVYPVNLGMLPAANYTIVASTYADQLLSHTFTPSPSINIISCCNAASSFTASSSSICSGDSVTFTSTSTAATSTTWFVNNVQVSTDTVFTYGFNSPGAQDVRLVVTGSSCSDSTAQTITVNNLPNVNLGIDTNYCSGSFVVLDAGSGWSAVNWSNGDTTRTTVVNAIGDYVATVQDGNGCWNSDTVSVSEIQSPVVNFGNDTILCQGTTLLLDATNPGATYTWTDGSKAATFLVTQTGGYGVTVMVGQCFTFDSIFVSYTTCTGLDSKLEDQISLHPNPANNLLILEFNGGVQENLDFVILDSRGTLVRSGIVYSNNKSIVLDVADLDAGIFILKISGSTGSAAKKIVIE
jgi:Secretion system C-terminal sorting domain